LTVEGIVIGNRNGGETRIARALDKVVGRSAAVGIIRMKV
jgi:hypothetical protein